MTLVSDPDNIRLALVGKVAENDHPYSWAAIFNGYDADAMARYADPIIGRYLGEQSADALRIGGARVTHVWCDDPAEARRVAEAGRVPHIVGAPEEVVGAVDAVLIPTDIGSEHVERARPFVEAGLPVFIDKPLTDREADLRRFRAWIDAGAAIISTSALRYAVEFEACRAQLSEVGDVRLITFTMARNWRRYGIHALEAVYPFLEPGGWLSAADTGEEAASIVHARHEAGVDAVFAVVDDLYGAFGCLNVYGTRGWVGAQFRDRFTPFKRQLEAFVRYLRTGRSPVSFEETAELMTLLMAAMRSRSEGGRRVALAEVGGVGRAVGSAT